MRQKRSTVNALAGTQRGDLTILRIDHLEPRTGNIWLCRCKCGKEVLLPTSRIMSGRSYSCPECGKRKKRDRGHLFWSEWEAVTERTRHLLKRHTGHSIMLTVDPLALSYAERQYKYQHKRKAADRASSHNRQGVEIKESFPPLIIPQ